MFFYHYILKKSDSINHAVTGNFSGNKITEIIISRGRNIEILCIHKPDGRLQSLLSINFNARILSLEKVSGLKKDYVAVGSDSGKFVILEYNLKKNCFKIVRQHLLENNKLFITTRFTPGQYLAVDPKSQVIAVGAIEQNLLFYTICDDPDAFINPVLKQESRCIFSDLVSIFNDTGVPSFAVLEAQYEKLLSPYPPDVLTEPSKKKAKILASSENLPRRMSSAINDFNTNTLAEDVASSIEDNLQSPSLSDVSDSLIADVVPSTNHNLQTRNVSNDFNKSDPLVKENVQPTSSSADNFNKCTTSRKRTFRMITKNVICCNYQSEHAETDGANDLPRKDQNKLPPMVLRIYELHWQSQTVFNYAIPLSIHANKLISVPPGDCHKSGILICFCNRVDFLEIETNKKIHSFFPQRTNLVNEEKKGMLISGSAIYKKDDKLLIFLQSEEGDLYSAKIIREDEHLKIKWTYIDTVPVASALCIIEEDYLFLAADYGDHFLYKIKSLESKDEISIFNITKSDKVNLFIARELTHLEPLSGIPNLSPIINCIAESHICIKNHVYYLDMSDTPIIPKLSCKCNELLQFHFACGQGSYSTLRTMRYGAEVRELKSCELSEYPDHMWTCVKKVEDDFVTLLIMSFLRERDNKILVRSINDEGIKEESNDQFEPINPKAESDHLLNYVHIDNDSSIQIFSYGVRYNFSEGKIEWKIFEETDVTEATIPEQSQQHTIHQCAIHNNQIALALKTKELIYIEVLRSEEGKFKFDVKRCEYVPDSAACCIDFLPSDGKAETLIICFENTIQMFSVSDEGICKESFVKKNLSYVPTSLVVCNAINGGQPMSYLMISFKGGYIRRFIFIHKNKKLKNSFELKLEDSKTLRLIKIEIDKEEAILALSTYRTWISFNCRTQFEFIPLLSIKLDCVVGFYSKSYPMANLIVVSDRKLMFLEVKKTFPKFVLKNCQQLELTPRQSVYREEDNRLIICLSDHGKPYHRKGEVTPQLAMDITLGRTDYSSVSDPKAKYLAEIAKNEPYSKYDCLLCVYDPEEKEFIYKLKMAEDHSIYRMRGVEFSSMPNEWYLLAIVKKVTYKYEVIEHSKPFPKLGSKEHFESYLILYELDEDGELEEICSKETDFAAEALCPFAGRVLVGIKDKLCLFNFEDGLFMEADLEMPCKISNIYANDDIFIVLCDNRNVIYGYLIKSYDGRVEKLELRILCEDQNLMKVTAVCFWDDDIIVAADIYGYLNVVLTPKIPDDYKDFKIPRRIKLKKKGIKIHNKEPVIEEYRFMPHSYVIARHYVGEVITSLQLTSFLKKSREFFLYSTLSASVGIFVPFFTEEPDDIFKQLQFLIKGKSQFHNADSTDYPSKYKNRKKLIEDELEMSDESITTPKSKHDDVDSTHEPENSEVKLCEDVSPVPDQFAMTSGSVHNNLNSTDVPENSVKVNQPSENISLVPDQFPKTSGSTHNNIDAIDVPEKSAKVDEPSENISVVPDQFAKTSGSTHNNIDAIDVPEKSAKVDEPSENISVVPGELFTKSESEFENKNLTDRSFVNVCQDHNYWRIKDCSIVLEKADINKLSERDINVSEQDLNKSNTEYLTEDSSDELKKSSQLSEPTSALTYSKSEAEFRSNDSSDESEKSANVLEPSESDFSRTTKSEAEFRNKGLSDAPETFGDTFDPESESSWFLTESESESGSIDTSNGSEKCSDMDDSSEKKSVPDEIDSTTGSEFSDSNSCDVVEDLSGSSSSEDDSSVCFESPKKLRAEILKRVSSSKHEKPAIIKTPEIKSPRLGHPHSKSGRKNLTMLVIDGNLCDLFHTLSEKDQEDIGVCLRLKPYEICEMLAELKARIHFGINGDWLEKNT